MKVNAEHKRVNLKLNLKDFNQEKKDEMFIDDFRV
jgi:hypothetical protein